MFKRGITAAAGAAALLAFGGAPAQAASCPAQPTYDPAVPTPQAVLGFPLGIGQPDPLTGEQITAYVEAVDDASDRVISFDAGKTWAGRPLKVAIVSSREHMRPQELNRIRERFVAVRDGRRESLRDSPALVWLAGNVHGDEKSGADAELKVLYELAARTDCAVRKVNDDVVTVIWPSQNPDGREADVAPERLRLRPQPRLVRAHAARDGGEGRAAAPLAGPGVRRRPRDGRQAVLLPAQRGPDPPRDRRRAGGVDQRHRRGQQGGLRLQRPVPARRRRSEHAGAGGVLLQLRRLRPVLHGLRRHRARDRVRRRRHDLREGRRLADRAARRPAVPHPVGDRRLGVAEPPPGARGLVADLAAGAGRGRAGRPPAQRGGPAPEHRPVPGARHQDPVVLPAARPPARRLAQAGRAAAPDGRRGAAAQAAAAARERPHLRRAQREQRPRAGGRLLDLHGPAAEALDPGDAR